MTRPLAGRPLRAAVLGAGHWHAHYTYEALASSSEVTLAAVADANGAVAERIARDFNCRGYADHVKLLDTEAVDVAFVYGRPCDMHGLATAVILVYNAALDIAGTFAIFVVLAALGVALHVVIGLVRKRVLFWAPSERPNVSA